MVALGRTLFAVHLVFLLLAAILIGGSVGGFWGGMSMIVSALLVIISWAIVAGLTVKALKLVHGVANGTGNLTQALKWSKGLFRTVTILSWGDGSRPWIRKFHWVRAAMDSEPLPLGRDDRDHPGITGLFLVAGVGARVRGRDG
jgi:hypothetical protein